MAADEAPLAPAAPSGRRVRLFLMVAGGLAAPSLALAAFFLTNTGATAPKVRPAAQAGRVIGAAPGVTHPSSVAPAPAAAPPTTSTTTAPAPPTVPARDPFAPLVSQAPAGGPSGR